MVGNAFIVFLNLWIGLTVQKFASDSTKGELLDFV